ncbi:MAG: hypothetical protein IKD90_11165 [Clostridiales bacterium]|nr:hypothetical protein [Clostridiales bacterium]
MFLAVLGVGLLAIILIFVIGHARQDDEYDMKKGCLQWFLSVSICVLLFIGFCMYSCLASFIKTDTRWYAQTSLSSEDKTRWSYYMFLPEAKHCFELYSNRGNRDPAYMVETLAYKSIEDMCSDLPEECEAAILQAHGSAPEETEDIRGVKVKQYEVRNDLLPIISEDEVSRKYGPYSLGCPRKYYINEYEDGTYRFVMFFQTI